LSSLIELTDYLVRSLVRDSDDVVVETGERRGEPVISIQVAEADRGAVIGRQGRTIRAIEAVLDAASRGQRPGLHIQGD